MRPARWLVVLIALPLAAPMPAEQAVVGHAVAWADPIAPPAAPAGAGRSTPDDGLIEIDSWIVEPLVAREEDIAPWSDWGPAAFGPPGARASTDGASAAPPRVDDPLPTPLPAPPTPPGAPPPLDPPAPSPAPPPEPQPDPKPQPGPQPEPQPDPTSCLLCLDLDLARLLS